jgi:hypothetical protein
VGRLRAGAIVLGPVDAYVESDWSAIHDRLLCADIARRQDLDESIAREEAGGLATRRKKIKSAQKKRRAHTPKNEIGRRYGLLRVVSSSTEKVWYGGALWVCVCDCGRIRTVRGVALRSGDVRSCSRFRHRKDRM